MTATEPYWNFCLDLTGSFVDYPFGEESAVFKIKAGTAKPKLFAIYSTQDDGAIHLNLKCDPVLAEQLRAEHPEIIPGYHMNKKHWNTIDCSGSLPQQMIFDLIEDSYDLVVASFPRSAQETLGWNRLSR